VADPYLGEIQAFAFPFASGGFNAGVWMACAGQIVPITRFTALFSLIGTLYGGNGTTTFALPNMTGVITNSQGTAPGIGTRDIGQTLGSPTVILTSAEMASHTHGLQLGARTATGGAAGPGTASNMAAIDPGFNGFVPTPSNTTLAPNAMSFTGGGLAHDNNQPTQALVWCIAVQGTFPSFS
jgi:microcystin-dependent protein